VANGGTIVRMNAILLLESLTGSFFFADIALPSEDSPF
jgi:hypothetical protein